MSKQHWVIVLFIALALSGLMLFTIPQGTSEASNQQAIGTQSATATATPMQLVVEARVGYLRAAPGMNAKRVGIVRRNTRLTVMGVAYYGTQIWYLVQLEGNEQAWISDSIVHVAGNAELVPTVNLTNFFSFTATPTRTPGKATVTFTRTPTRTPVITQAPTRRATSVNVPATNKPNPTATQRSQPTNVPPTTISQPTNPPPPTAVIASATHIPQPTNPPPPATNPPTNVPQPTNPPPPTVAQPTNPPQPTAVPPTNVPQPTNPPPPTAVPPPPQPTFPPAPTSQPVPPTAANGNT